MLLVNIVTLVLLASSTTAAPSAPSPLEDQGAPEGDPLEAAESGHFCRKRVWRKLLKHLNSLGTYGLGGFGLDLLTGIGHLHKHHHGHQGGSHTGGHHGHGGGGGYGYHGHENYGGGFGDYLGGSYGGVHPGFPNVGYGSDFDHGFSLGHGGVASTDLGLWGNSWGVPDGYGWGGYGAHHFDNVWL